MQAEYTKEEVMKHRSEQDCWMIFRGEVLRVPADFDVTHPGGPVYMDAAGCDGTIMFEDAGHPDAARDMLKSWVIGRVAKPST